MRSLASLIIVLYLSVSVAIGQIDLVHQEEEEKLAEDSSYEVLLQYSQERLSRGLGTWRSAMVSVERRGGNNQIVWASYRHSDRNSIQDREFIAGVYKRFGNKWAATSEVMYSPTSQFVGKYSVMGEVEKDLGRGFVGHAGTRYTVYDGVKATSAYGLMEKYWGNNRAAYTLYITNLTNAGTAPTHRVQYNRYFGERSNSIGATISFGREHENLGPGIGIIRSDTVSGAISGRIWLTDKIGINIDGSLHRQGDLYYRGGLNFGTRFRF